MKNNTTTSDFYCEILRYLYELNNVDVTNTIANIKHQFVFYNKRLKIDGKLMYDDKLFSAGLWPAKDLFYEDGTIVPFNVWKSRGVSKSKFMIWRGLVEVVRTYNCDMYSCDMLGLNIVISLPTLDIIDLHKHSSNEMYRKLIRLKGEYPKSIQYYLKQFPNIEIENFETVFLIPRVCTKEMIVKEFQYKLLHRYLPTNVLLYKMKKVNSSKCSFCHMYSETIKHVSCECYSVKSLWFKIEFILSKISGSEVSLTFRDIILGYHIEDNPNAHLFINNILLHVKVFVWKCKLLYLNPSYVKLKEYVSFHKIYDDYLGIFEDQM